MWRLAPRQKPPMTSTLHPCASCSRHVLGSEERCPFCGVALPFSAVLPRKTPKGRLSRAALVALGTLSVTPQVACGGAAEDGAAGDGDVAGDGDAGDDDVAGDDVAGDDDGMTASGGIEGEPPYPMIAPAYGLVVTPDPPNQGGMGGELPMKGDDSMGGASDDGSGGLPQRR